MTHIFTCEVCGFTYGRKGDVMLENETATKDELVSVCDYCWEKHDLKNMVRTGPDGKPLLKTSSHQTLR